MDIKTENFYKDIASDVKKRFDTWNYKEDHKRPLLRGMNKNVIGLFKNELEGNILTEFVALRPKTYSYLMDDGNKATEIKKN